MAVTNDLLKVIVPPQQIVPVGITPALNVNGKISTQIQGKGDGIFSKIINGAAIIYSTAKQSAGTVGAIPSPGINAGATYGTGQDTQTQTGVPVSEPWYETKILGLSLWQILLALGAAKLLKIF